MKILLAILLLGYTAHAQILNPAPAGKVIEGVYFQKNGYQTSILELKAGHFRYWFSSDMKMPGDITRFPHQGAYATNGGEVTIVVTNSYLGLSLNGTTNTNQHRLLRTNRWTFMQYNDQPTLWRPEVLKNWDGQKRSLSYGVLFPTEKKPEEIWDGQ